MTDLLASGKPGSGGYPRVRSWIGPGWQGLSVANGAQLLLRHKRLLGGMTVLGLLAALIFSALEPRMYRSQATVQIQGVNENFLDLREVFPTIAPSADNAAYIQTQAEMLREDALIERVVRKLHFDQRPELFGPAPLREGITGSQRNPGDIRQIVEQVKASLDIVPVRGSSIIRIVCSARNPRAAADVANTVAETFVEDAVESRRRAAKQTESALSAELVDAGRSLLVSQAQFASYGDSLRPKHPAESVKYETAKRQLEANRQFYELLSRRIDEARLASSLAQANVRLAGPAQPAAHPYKPRLLLNLVGGIFGGFALGLMYVLYREQTRTLVRKPGDAAGFLLIPELGTIPNVNGAGFGAFFRKAAPGKPLVERASFEQSFSGVAEGFRATLASILAADRNGHEPRVLLVTSSHPMEGKTTVVSNLGIALAAIGRKVLLVDADLRRPGLHKIFDQANSWGLTDLLRERNAIEGLPLQSLVKKTMVPRLFLLPGGTPTDNLFALLWSERMARLFPRFRKDFDYVLVDTPPCLEFADARIIGRHAERALLVIRADYTERASAEEALERLSVDGIHVSGFILNRWDPSQDNLYAYGSSRTRA